MRKSLFPLFFELEFHLLDAHFVTGVWVLFARIVVRREYSIKFFHMHLNLKNIKIEQHTQNHTDRQTTVLRTQQTLPS